MTEAEKVFLCYPNKVTFGPHLGVIESRLFCSCLEVGEGVVSGLLGCRGSGRFASFNSLKDTVQTEARLQRSRNGGETVPGLRKSWFEASQMQSPSEDSLFCFVFGKYKATNDNFQC